MVSNNRYLCQHILLILIHLYIFMTLLFYALFISGSANLCGFAMPAGRLNYYALLGALSLSQTQGLISQISPYIMIAIEIVYPITLLGTYLIAWIKKSFNAFFVLSVINVLFAIVVILICEVCSEKYWWPDIKILADVLSNTIYCIIFSIFLKKNRNGCSTLEQIP